MRSPVRLREDDRITFDPAPEYGGDTNAVLSLAGYSDDEIATLASAGVIRQVDV